MGQRALTLIRFLLLSILLFGFNITFSQIRHTAISTDSIKSIGMHQMDTAELSQFGKMESAIYNRQNLKQLYLEVLLLKQQAITSHDDIKLARSLYELMQINDQRTEDSLYFRNSAFMDTILNDKNSSATLKAIMHVLRAERLNNFTHHWLKFNRAAYRSKDIPFDYGALTNEQLDSLWTNDLTAALTYHADGSDVQKLLWLSSNPGVFLFGPQFADIVLSEYINQASLKDQYNFTAMGTWPSLPSDLFREKLDSVAHENKGTSVLKGYRNWLAFNKKDNARSAFIESLARKYIFSFTSEDTVSYRLYTAWLKLQTASPYPTVKAFAIYQLCLIWNTDGSKYAGNLSDVSFNEPGTYEKKYQYLPDSALKLYKENKYLLYAYTQLNSILMIMAEQIRAPSLSVSFDDKALPGHDIPIRAIYHNIDTLYYRVVRVNTDEPRERSEILATPQLIGRPAVASGVFALPLPPDHNKHAVYLKLAALPAGRYRLLFNYSGFKADSRAIYNIPFQVTNIAAINSDERIYVLDRKTGAPLQDASVRAFQKGVSVTHKVSAVVNKQGYILMPEDVADSISIICKGDTLGYSFTIHNYNSTSDDDNIYDKDEYDDLGDFYDDKLSMNIFTDRSIYRPGQTVHYKIILFTRDPQTGDRILFDQQNLKSGWFNKVVAGWLKSKQAFITLNDPFSHDIDSAKLIPNDFGSFAGSFVLPKTAATGEWSIDGPIDKDNRNEGDFRVEEYKRPTIELSMEKQQKMLRPGQPFTIKLKLRSFSGASLQNIPIKYTINRSGMLPSKSISIGYNNNTYVNQKLSDTVGYTNEKGELSIPVNDTLLAKYKWGDDFSGNYNYAVEATATDATGETTEISENLAISSRPIRINIPVNQIYDRQSLPLLSVNTANNFEGVVGRKVAVKIYAVGDPVRNVNIYKSTDQWYYTEAEWNKWFPELAVNAAADEKHELIIDTVINTASYGKLVLPKNKLNTGFYELEADCRDADSILIGHTNYNFKVFDSGVGTTPGDVLDYMPVNSAKPDDVITWYNTNKTGTYAIYEVLYASGKKGMVKSFYTEENEQPGLNRWAYRIPADVAGNLQFSRIYVSNNQVIRNSKMVYLTKPADTEPEVIIEKYRKVMAPDDKETFTLSVKTKNENTAAEIMTTLYDASLDKLNPHSWNIPNSYEYHRDPWPQWPYAISFRQQAGNFESSGQIVTLREIGVSGFTNFTSGLTGRAPGLFLADAPGLREVVVTGYGTQAKRDLTGSVVTIRGNASLKDYREPLTILDGVPYTGGLDKLDPNAITQAVVLKGADASALYGAQAANGVLIISTKGPIVLPQAPEPVVKIRKDFNETAFFFPQVHADADGYYTFSFIVPESATEWNWKVLAHTRTAKFAYLERKLQTQLNLMVQPNIPRLLYQGDEIKLQSRITNLDTVNIAGKITCKIEDAVTGEDITSQLLPGNQQPFKLAKQSSGSAAFYLKVPAGQLHPLKVVVTALAPGAADAEEHTIPVLSPKILVRQSQPVRFGQLPALTLSVPKFPSDAQFGIGMSIDQKPQATLINALPWLANYSYDCAEQTFNKLNALATALRLMQKDTLAQKMYADASKVAGREKSKDTQFPDEMPSEAMPWLNIGMQTSTQQQELLKILDTLASKAAIQKHLERLYKLQQYDGGLAWFDGGKSNDYISAYVLAGFGRLKQQGWKLSPSDNVRYRQFITDLYKYIKGNVLKHDVKDYDMYQVYALSYWLTGIDTSHILFEHANLLLTDAWKNVNQLPLNRQAMLIISSHRYNGPGSVLFDKAEQQLENISQLAIRDKQNGVRWKDISDAEELNISAEETMALLAEAFWSDPQMNEGMAKWVLTTRQDQHWQTTKATAAAIDMLQKDKGSVIGPVKSFSTDIDGQHLAVSDDMLNGVPTAFVATKQTRQTIVLQQQGTGASGALISYYFANPESLDTLNKAIHIRKQFYSYNKINGWVPFDNHTHLTTGDKVRVKLTIETASRLDFVHISDPRAAAFEPGDNHSGYQYDGGLSYYRSVKDTGLELFIDSVPRGISEIDYEMVVAMEGHFSSGPAVLQCMYRPANMAYSSASIIVTN